MKTLINLLFTILLFGQTTAQTSITIKPDASEGKDARISIGGGDPNTQSTNYGDHPNVVLRAWTFNALPVYYRSLIDFDLSILDASDKILSASINLYHDPLSPLGATHHPASGLNQTYFVPITSPWEEGSVTWDTQPSLLYSQAISVRGNRSDDENFLDIDVTDMIKNQFENPDSFHGVMIILQDESPHQRLVFASSDNANPALHPELHLIVEKQMQTSITEHHNQRKIFPNPTKTTLNILGDVNDCDCLIYSTDGKIINQITCQSQIDIENLKPGVYFIKIINNISRQSESIRFIKEE